MAAGTFICPRSIQIHIIGGFFVEHLNRIINDTFRDRFLPRVMIMLINFDNVVSPNLGSKNFTFLSTMTTGHLSSILSNTLGFSRRSTSATAYDL